MARVEGASNCGRITVVPTLESELTQLSCLRCHRIMQAVFLNPDGSVGAWLCICGRSIQPSMDWQPHTQRYDPSVRGARYG
jgi:hypothetical protein